MNYERIQKDLRDFKERHGTGEPLQINGVWVYPDGARRSIGGTCPTLMEPPADPAQRAKIQLSWYEERVRLAEQRFKQRRAELTAVLKRAEGTASHPQHCHCPSQLDVASLKKLQEDVLRCRRALERVRQSLDRDEPEEAKERKRYVAETQARVARMSAEVEAIQI